MKTGRAGPSRSSKALSKAKLAPKKGNGHWWSTVGLIYYSFLNPGEMITPEKYAQQTNEMHGNLQHLWPGLVNRKGAIVLHDSGQSHAAQPVLQNWNQLSQQVLPHLPHSLDLLLPTDHHFFKHLDNFCRENASTTSRRQKILSKSSSNPKTGIFMLQE